MAHDYLRSIDDALWERLAHPSAKRSGGITQVPPVPAAAPSDIHDASAVELARVSYELTQGIAQGTIGGIPLRRHFERSLVPLYGDRHNACQRAVAEFLRTEHARGVDMLGLRRGRSVVEAFGDFLASVALDADHAVLIRHECLTGLVKTLTRAPEPGFRVADPLVFRTSARSWVAYCSALEVTVDTAPTPRAPVVFASCGERFFSGHVTPVVLAALLATAEAPPPWTADVDAGHVEATRSHLRARGLVA